MPLDPLFDFFEVLCAILLVGIILVSLTLLTVWGLSGGLKKFFSFKKKKENRGHQGW